MPSVHSPNVAVVLQCVAVCCSVLQCVAVCCSVWQYAAVCCSVFQQVAVRIYAPRTDTERMMRLMLFIFILSVFFLHISGVRTIYHTIHICTHTLIELVCCTLGTFIE